jgi:hypothetical protein
MRWYMMVGRDVLLFAYGCLHNPPAQSSGMCERDGNWPHAHKRAPNRALDGNTVWHLTCGNGHGCAEVLRKSTSFVLSHDGKVQNP